MPSPSPALGLTEIQSHLLASEILVVFELDRPHSRRWLIDRDHAIFDTIAGRDAIEAATDPVVLGALLFRDISTAAGRPMLAVGDSSLRQLPFETAVLGGEPVDRRHSVAWFESVERLVALRRAEPPAIAARLRLLAVASGLAAAVIVFRRVFAVSARG